MTELFYPDLKIVPIDHIVLQEHVRKSRMQKLADSIREEGILRNPPIVANFFQGKYLHLDGANRITAIRMLGYSRCLVQVVDYSDPTHVHLMSWSHLVTVNEKTFLKPIQSIESISIRKLTTFSSKYLLQSHVVCLCMFRNGDIYEVSSDAPYKDAISHLGSIVGTYADSEVERVFSASPWNSDSIQTRFDRYSEKNLFVAFPNFSPQQVISLVDQGVLMPAGVTRHVVYRRKLNVNMPLEFLELSSVEEANARLQAFLQHRIVRLYEEPIIYFE